jgi:hypothetical protein
LFFCCGPENVAIGSIVVEITSLVAFVKETSCLQILVSAGIPAVLRRGIGFLFIFKADFSFNSH